VAAYYEASQKGQHYHYEHDARFYCVFHYSASIIHMTAIAGRATIPTMISRYITIHITISRQERIRRISASNRLTSRFIRPLPASSVASVVFVIVLFGYPNAIGMITQLIARSANINRLPIISSIVIMCFPCGVDIMTEITLCSRSFFNKMQLCHLAYIL
jgi:hypothetical protein